MNILLGPGQGTDLWPRPWLGPGRSLMAYLHHCMRVLFVEKIHWRAMKTIYPGPTYNEACSPLLLE